MPRVPSASNSGESNSGQPNSEQLNPGEISSGTGSTQITVERLLATLDHPRKAEILSLRRLILNVDPAVTENVKWNAPNFRTSEDFATFHLRTQDSARLILHLGAKKRADSGIRASLSDPDNLLTWLAPDRAAARFRTQEEIAAHHAGFTAVLRQWITFL